MNNSEVTLFDTEFMFFLNSKKSQIDQEILNIKKYSFEKNNSERIKENVFNNLKIGKYPIIIEEKPKSEILKKTEDQAQYLIPYHPTSMNNREVEIRHINLSVKFTGESSLLKYRAETIGPLVFRGGLYANSISLDFYFPMTISSEQQAQNYQMEKNNAVHQIKTGMEASSKAFDSFVEIIKTDINSKIDKEFKNIDDSLDFDSLIR